MTTENPCLFAAERELPAVEDCYFYHSMTIPGHGEVSGEWDLRGREQDYLGHIELAGKKVLEIGTASGYLGFWMEQQGAVVTGYDLSDQQEWDIVPYHDLDYTAHIAQRKAHIRRLNNSWWFARKHFQSRARVAYGTIYELSPQLGRYDIVTLGSILLHLRDPFLALQKAAGLALESLVVTDLLVMTKEQALSSGEAPFVRFMPDARSCSPTETWWRLSPQFVAETAKILGFKDIDISVHRQRHAKGELDLYTLVGSRAARTQARRDHDAHNHARGWRSRFSSRFNLRRTAP
jgi:hypothetical protein